MRRLPRVVNGKIVFVCVEGPEFDAHQVDFDSLMRRNNAYRDIEQEKNTPASWTRRSRR